MKLMNSTEFIFHLRNMTTSELYSTYPTCFKEPLWTGDKDEFVKQMLAFDAKKWMVVGEHAKMHITKCELWMFTPVTKNNEIALRPFSKDRTQEEYAEAMWLHKQEVNKVLFKGFEIISARSEYFVIEIKGKALEVFPETTIGELVTHGIEVTDAYLKKIGLL